VYKIGLSPGGVLMRKMKFGILLMIAVLALVSVASASLPNLVDVNAIYPNTVSYWKADVLTAGAAPELPKTDPSYIPSWCTDTDHYLTSGSTNTFMAYDSRGSIPSGVPTEDWKAVNYILSNPPSNGDWRIKQAAMWHYDGMSGAAYPEHDNVVGYDHAVYNAYISEINSNKETFNPQCGQSYAIILYHGPPDFKTDQLQTIIVEGKTDQCQNTPEFPTLALPVAMLIGMIGAVQYIGSRKE
jgi:hypothetical protein